MSISIALSALADDVTAARAKITSKGGGVSTKKCVQPDFAAGGVSGNHVPAAMAGPIPYDGNMELFAGLYYVQNSVTYLCNRNAGQPVYNALDDLLVTIGV